jgi:hypothetical protein
MFAVTECRVAIHYLGDKFLVFRVQVAEVGKLPITTVNAGSSFAIFTSDIRRFISSVFPTVHALCV